MKFIYLLILNCIFSSFLYAGNLDISYKMNKAVNLIGPDEDMVKITFNVTQNNVPVEAKLHIVLDSPPVNSIISTDFPIVEGTRLFDTTGITQNGMLEMSYLFPIRGQYNLHVTAKTLNSNSTETSQNFVFTLNENPGEVSNFYIMVSILIIFGLISGIVLSKGSIRKTALEDRI